MNITAKHNLSFNVDSQNGQFGSILKITDLRPIVSFWSVDSQQIVREM